MASCLMRAAATHLGPRGQADIITAHFEFITRTEVGPAVIVVDEVKLGRRLSTVHVSLYQGGLTLDGQAPFLTSSSQDSGKGVAASRREVVAYFNCGSLEVEKGLSLPTEHDFADVKRVPKPPKPDLAALSSRGQDLNWARLEIPEKLGGLERRALHNMEYYFPRAGQPQKSVVDVWLRLAEPGAKFDNVSLGYVADSWPYVVEAYRGGIDTGGGGKDAVVRQDDVFWFPTVVMNMDVKKALPLGGVEWLSMRVEARQIRNGRLDLEVVLLDEAGELVAICHHVNLVLGGERNLKKRTKL